MAARVSIVKKSFKNDAGEPVTYERLAITGTIEGEVHTLEIALSKGELLAAKMLLASTEKLEVHHVPGGGEVNVRKGAEHDDALDLFSED